MVMVGFNIWCWFLAMTGYTSVEWWIMFNSPTTSERFQFSFETVSDNLFAIFGTNKIFRIFSPSLRNVPLTGLEWSFLMQDLGYD